MCSIHCVKYAKDDTEQGVPGQVRLGAVHQSVCNTFSPLHWKGRQYAGADHLLPLAPELERCVQRHGQGQESTD